MYQVYRYQKQSFWGNISNHNIQPAKYITHNVLIRNPKRYNCFFFHIYDFWPPKVVILPCVRCRETRRSQIAINNCASSSKDFFVTSRNSKMQFLVSICIYSSDLCVCLSLAVKKPWTKLKFTLTTANNSIIYAYGLLQLDVGLRRAFSWSFTIADVSNPIIGTRVLQLLRCTFLQSTTVKINNLLTALRQFLLRRFNPDYLMLLHWLMW